MEVKKMEKSALGIVANNVATFSVKASEPLFSRSDEILNFRKNNRKKLNELDKKIKNILVGELADEFKRVKKCGEAIFAPDKRVSLLYNDEHQVAHYGGLVTCGSVWACPHCSSKIQLRRRGEVAELIERVYSAGYKVSMITLTHPHQREFTLKENIEIFNDALRRLKQQRRYRKYIKDNAEIGYIGDITCREVTWGDTNGWHWHAHRLVIVKNPALLVQYAGKLKEMWVHCYELACRDYGRDFTEKNKKYMMERGLDIIEKAQSTDYLVKIGNGKWGAEKELVGVAKKGKVGRYTAFDLVGRRDDKFIEYLQATKGKRQLLYSKGLRALFGLDVEKTDEELAQEQIEHSREIAKISWWEWKKILNENLKVEICEILESAGGDPARLKNFLRDKNINITFLGFDDGG